MLENLISLVKERAGGAIINNPAIPNEQNEAAIQETSSSITSGLQEVLSGGNGVKDLLSMFGGGSVDGSPVTSQVTGNVADNLVNKLGIERNEASGIAGSLVPDVLKNLVNRTNNPNDNSFDLQSIFNQLSGGKTEGMNLQALLAKFTGGSFDKDGDGDTDLQDVMAMFKGNNAGGGGILDSVKGMFGK